MLVWAWFMPSILAAFFPSSITASLRLRVKHNLRTKTRWIPAFAGMTDGGEPSRSSWCNRKNRSCLRTTPERFFTTKVTNCTKAGEDEKRESGSLHPGVPASPKNVSRLSFLVSCWTRFCATSLRLGALREVGVSLGERVG